MIKTGNIFIKKKYPIKTIINFNILSVELCWHPLFHDRMSIWWSLDANNFWFEAYVTNLEIDFFTYPTLTKCIAEIALPGCDSNNK